MKSFYLLLACLVVANLSFAQEKQSKQTEESPMQVIIIKKTRDADGNVKTEKIVREGKDLQELHIENDEVILQEVGDKVEKTIQVIVHPEMNDIEMNQKIDVQVDAVNGEKEIKVRIQPQDGEDRVIEWQGEGEIPVEIREKLEKEGVFLQEMDEGEQGEKKVFIFRNGDKEAPGKAQHFTFRSEGADSMKMHTVHRIVVVTRGETGGIEQNMETQALPAEALPETALPRSLQLRDYALFPNPTDGRLRLRFAADAVPTVIKISDLSGKRLYRERLNRFDGRYDQAIDLTDLPAGLLLLSIEQADKVYTEQIILK